MQVAESFLGNVVLDVGFGRTELTYLEVVYVYKTFDDKIKFGLRDVVTHEVDEREFYHNMIIKPNDREWALLEIESWRKEKESIAQEALSES